MARQIDESPLRDDVPDDGAGSFARLRGARHRCGGGSKEVDASQRAVDEEQEAVEVGARRGRVRVFVVVIAYGVIELTDR